MPCYRPDARKPQRPSTRSDVRSLLAAVQQLRDPAADSGRSQQRVITSCLRIAAAYRTRIMQTEPALWRSIEIHYRQHVRQGLRAGEARHWDAALQLPE
jgi:hypothetical protein